MKEMVMSQDEIQSVCQKLGSQLTQALIHEEKVPLFVGVMKGALNFFYSLIPNVKMEIFTDFVETSSYEGTQSTGTVTLTKDLSFSPDGRTAALIGALARMGDPAFVDLGEIAGTSRGTDGLADWLLARAGETAALAIDGRAGTAPLVKRLIDRGYPRRGLVECRAADAQASVAMLLDEVNAGTVTHIESPALDDSATKSIRRKIGSMGGFGFGDGPGSIACPVESAALALWAARTARRDPSRRQVVW